MPEAYQGSAPSEQKKPAKKKKVKRKNSQKHIKSIKTAERARNFVLKDKHRDGRKDV